MTMFIHFFCLCPRPHYQAEFQYIENGLLIKTYHVTQVRKNLPNAKREVKFLIENSLC